MSHTPSHPPPPSPPPSQVASSIVRRHHTFSSASRTAHVAGRTAVSEEQQYWPEDEPIATGWEGGELGGAAGVHRQSSLPSKRGRAFRGNQGTGPHSGSVTPSRIVNSLSAITAEHGAEGEGEEDWEKEMKTWNGEEHAESNNNGNMMPPMGASLSRSGSQSSRTSASPMFSPPMHSGSPPPAQPISSIRRHQSMKDRPPSASVGAGLVRAATHGKRSGPRSGRLHERTSPPLPGEQIDDDNVEDLPPSAISRNVWNNEHDVQAGEEWHNQNHNRPADDTIEEVQRALAGVNLGSEQMSQQQQQQHYYQSHQPTPLRMNAQPHQQHQQQQQQNPNKLSAPTQPPRFASPTIPSSNMNQQPQQLAQPYPPNTGASSPGSRSPHKLHLITDLPNQGYPTPQKQGPVSAAAYVPLIGQHGPSNHGQRHGDNNGGGGGGGGNMGKQGYGGPPHRGGGGGHANRDKPLTASDVVWNQKDRLLGDGQDWDPNAIPPVPPLNPQNYAGFGRAGGGFMGPNELAMNYLGLPQQQQQQMAQMQLQQQLQQGGVGPQHRLNMDVNSILSSSGGGHYAGGGMQGQMGQGNSGQGGMGGGPGAGGAGQGGMLTSPVDVPSLIAAKGYNPATFDVRPAFARFFVIKSYTEDDVHKSLKYEIWSSTDLGNKRLDKAFKECAGRGPIYLFFSVNASGHFCGMAEMLTPVDYTRSSTVWAQDKWKGVFKVRWIFIRDVPNATLRHIRLNNTQERKPVTNSRDTQELLPDAGQEMLRIFFTHPARTSLLQDFAFYELQSIQKGLGSPIQQQPAAPQHPYAMLNHDQQQQMLMQMQSQSQYGPSPQNMQNMGSGTVSPPQRHAQGQGYNNNNGGPVDMGGRF